MYTMKKVELGQVPVGELVIWPTRPLGDVLAEVLSHTDEGTHILADNNINYLWPNDMMVFVDA